MTAVEDLTIEELQTLIKTTVEETMQELIEDLLAMNNPAYLASIEKARKDYQAGRIKRFENVFHV
jgi:hypothetical protein